MDHKHFEGMDVLEHLATLDLLDPFFMAVEAADLEKIGWLLRGAGFEENTIEEVLRIVVRGEFES